MKAITQLWIDVGMKKQRLESEGYKRYDIMRSHGMRKFFEGNAFKVGMDHIYIRRLLGQRSGLEDSYLKLSEEELLEGDSKHAGYIGIIDQLTIHEENRLKRKVDTLTMDRTKLESRLDRLEELYQSFIDLPSTISAGKYCKFEILNLMTHYHYLNLFSSFKLFFTLL